MNNQALFKTGLYCFLLALIFGVILSVGIEINIILEESIIFYMLVIFANIGLLVFVCVGLLLWFKYFTSVYRGCNVFALWLYIGCMGFSGYWAHRQVKNGYLQHHT